jgi:RsiW-degrading membrane proteinase PrsW (M82 family)
MEIGTVTLANIGYAILGGVGPVLLWLWFWLKEARHPEPPAMITLVFLAGATSVAFIIPMENAVGLFIHDPWWLYVALSAIEEIGKFVIVAVIVFHGTFIDDPTDYAIYMIVGALGFAATENVLYLLDPLSTNNITVALLTGNLRFLGATVLHTAASSIIGLSLGLAFYKNNFIKFIYLIIGFIGAIGLHAVFNFFIIGSQNNIFPIFAGLWVVVIFILLIFERVKVLQDHHERMHENNL